MTDVWLSEHFSLAELTFSATAARLGIVNVPNSQIVERLRRLASALEQVRDLLGHPIHVTSGYRSVALNAHVPGSSDTSAHTLGWAADFQCPGFGPPREVCEAISRSSLGFDQLIYEYAAWTHLSVDPRRRRQVLTKRQGHPYEIGLIG